MNKTPDVEKYVEEFMHKHTNNIKTVSIGQYDENGVNIGFKTAYNLIKEDVTTALTKTLQAERQKRDSEIRDLQDELRDVKASHKKLAENGLCKSVIRRLKMQLTEQARKECDREIVKWGSDTLSTEGLVVE